MDRTLKEVLMERDGNTAEKAEARIAAAKKEVVRHINAGHFDKAESVCERRFGLEPDYLDYLIY